MKRAGIHTKLIRVFITQLLLISAATIIGVYASAKIVEDVLVRKALEGEAEHYWELYSSNPEYPLPNTMNLTGFLAVNENHSAVPLEFHDLQPGYGRAALEGHNPIVHVSDNGSARLYLVFDEVQVSQLALYFGIAPLTGVLVVLYLFAWFTYRQSRRAVSPLVRLAKTVADFDIKNAKLAELDFGHYHDTADAEVVTLIEALNEFTGRLEEFINRERNFTRDASHELRTPLTVIKGSTELLKQRGNLSKEDEETVRRVQQTSEDMEALINTLLVLAREEDIQQHGERVVINDVIAEQLDILKDVHDLSAYEIVLKQSSLLEINAPS
ncbi:MAG: HAMP domain-containing histidine kinase, partial [Gammaproteobacteria bacterium]|nr:HAMP domain-containing histidine kinase [Gammaproteobacteria bacterium]